MDLNALLISIYEALRGEHGHRGWWPGDGPFEVMVGAILTQRTNWNNVEKAIAALAEAGVLNASALARMERDQLQDLIRPAGYYRQKAARLKRLAGWVMERTGGDLDALAGVRDEELRQELLALRGIGPETADSILLYALDRPVFVVDTYTKRVVVRHGLMEPACGYYELQELFQDALPHDVELFKDYHAQLVEVGKRNCRARPRCESCPLRPVLGRPVEEDGY